MKAIWNDTVVAESHETIVVEGNHYFPPASVHEEYLKPSDRKTTCHWKGVASYYDIRVGGAVNPGAVWYYPDPKEAAREIKGYLAFWRGVDVVE